jgi:hypothetical protein
VFSAEFVLYSAEFLAFSAEFVAYSAEIGPKKSAEKTNV